ncbi:homeobox domain-containing protein [Zalerion maritima]|uniref:Homeobox domain-containing protein n=1 Tax=Zalerion maritima TaxID=339359 RepID=A0AAD5RGP8_9PEZI|nr:homeobox domain-containing protein [Zalerion maritima]
MEFGLSPTTRAPEPPTTTGQGNKMSIVAMAAPSPHAAFRGEFVWDERSRPIEYSSPSSRPRTEPERIALPSIRQVLESTRLPPLGPPTTNPGSQAIPEFRMPPIAPQERSKSSTTSPTVGIGAMTPPEYVHSPNSSNNKRRRLSIEDEQESGRTRQVPRLYNSPPRVSQQLPHHYQQQRPQISSSGPSPILPPTSGTDNWPTKTSHYASSDGGALPSMRSPAPVEVEQRFAAPEPRPTRPSLPPLPFDRSPASGNAPPAPPAPRHRSQSGDDYAPDSSRVPQSIEPHRTGQYSYAPPPLPSAYQHPNRIQSLSLESVHHPVDRTQFSSAVPPYSGAAPHHYPDYLRIGEVGMGMPYGMPGMGIGMGVDCTKQRKRRGNLPKETTDKLRSWFMAHLHHPYPTEDEKQELMRQTGLQMNQISNWFINARRRALPQMLNDQRMAEAKAAAQGNVLPTTERNDYDGRVKRDSAPLSDGGAVYDDDLDRRRISLKRGSV